jgi:hypothetical protein
LNSSSSATVTSGATPVSGIHDSSASALSIPTIWRRAPRAQRPRASCAALGARRGSGAAGGRAYVKDVDARAATPGVRGRGDFRALGAEALPAASRDFGGIWGAPTARPLHVAPPKGRRGPAPCSIARHVPWVVGGQPPDPLVRVVRVPAVVHPRARQPTVLQPLRQWRQPLQGACAAQGRRRRRSGGTPRRPCATLLG